jgi:hypothetical protein
MTSTTAATSIEEGEAEHLPTDPNISAADERRSVTGTGSLPTDDLFHLLQNSRRRAVLRYLRGREGPVRMRDVAEQVAAWEHGTTVARLTSEERQRVYITLYQSHLDTLAEAGVIDYNKPRGVIEPRPLLDRVASFLDPDWSDESEDEADGDEPEADVWSRSYLFVSAIGGLLFAGATLGLLAGGTAGVLVVSLFTGLTLTKLALDGGTA